jgi:hypothetical protein
MELENNEFCSVDVCGEASGLIVPNSSASFHSIKLYSLRLRYFHSGFLTTTTSSVTVSRLQMSFQFLFVVEIHSHIPDTKLCFLSLQNFYG